MKYIFIIILLASCVDTSVKKPFIVTRTEHSIVGGTYYFYTDANGNQFNFKGGDNLYNIGDTIK